MENKVSSDISSFEEKMMRRALQIASNGQGSVSPNPMVGAVIAMPDGRIIGEGWHRKFGEGHAEVNAIASVSQEESRLLSEATMYVTLEPCSHYGKTPPCARLLIDKGIKKVVVGAVDPNPKVSGRGVKMLKDVGVEVTTGVLADESEALNKTFFTAHRLGRPFVTLKWACSADGFMDIRRETGSQALKFSSPESLTSVHRLRGLHDIIMVGSGTIISDKPRLDCRRWPGKNPQPVILDRSGILKNTDLSYMPVKPQLLSYQTLEEVMNSLYKSGYISVLVEGGSVLLKSFVTSGLWDEAREEIAPVILGEKGTALCPVMPVRPYKTEMICDNIINYYRH